MKISFYISVAASALSLILAVIIFAVGSGNQKLQGEIQAQQKEVQQQQADLQKQEQQINVARQISETVGPNLLREMAVVSLKNEKMKALLGKHGYNVQQQAATPAPGGGGAAAPAPAPAPAASPTVPTVPTDSAPALR